MVKQWIPRSRIGISVLVLLVAGLVGGFVGWDWGYVTWQIRTARQQLRDAQIVPAILTLQAAEAKQPDRDELLYLLARAFRRAENQQAATHYLNSAQEAGWSAEELRHQRYLLMVQLGLFEQAGPYLTDVLQQEHDDELAYEIYEALAKGHLRNYNFQQALLALNHFIEWRPDALEPRMWRGDIWERRHDHQKAREEYEDVLKHNPNHAEALRKLGDCHQQLNQPETALTNYQRSLKIRPNSVHASLGAAVCLRSLGNVDEAESYYRELLTRELAKPLRAEVLMGLAQIAVENKDFLEAAELLEEVLKIHAYDSAAHHLLGTVYTKQDNPEQASKEFELAKTYKEQMNRFAKITLTLFDEPENAELRYEAGAILMKQGDKANGAAWMATALQFAPYHIPTHRALADYYAEIGDKRTEAYHRRILSESGQAPGKSPGENDQSSPEQDENDQ